ncbi:MAG: hypothetical protein GY729_08870, partial [Desulfobacteraceae bacterium]|nr:hypothetical protein [Desulfobacteraceae bacterium]
MKNKIKLKFWGHSLAGDMIVGQVAVVALSTIILVCSGYLMLSKRADRLYELKSSAFVSFLQKSLAVPLWNIDEESINIISKSFVQNDLVASLEVVDSSELRLFSYHDENAVNVIEQIAYIEYNGEIIGEVKIGITTSSLKEHNRHLIITIVITICVVLVALVAATSLLIRSILQKPLDQLITGLEMTAKGDYNYHLRHATQKEIQIITSKFNDMGNKVKMREESLTSINELLGHEIHDRKQAEGKVRKLNEELEQRV